MTLLQIVNEPEVNNGLQLFDKLGPKFFVRLLIDIVSVSILVRFIYFPIYKKKDFFFTFFLFNIIIFMITYLLNKVDMSTGAAFGLFAVFSLLRYRTENISAKDMTYLFTVIAMGLISAVNKGTYFETCLINVIIATAAFLCSVIFYTGISEFFLEEKYWHEYSVLDEECCQTLIDKKVSMIGLDTASADNLDGFPIHKKLLGADILIIENLTNLKGLVGKTFEFQTLPIKLENDGAPVRAIARIKK